MHSKRKRGIWMKRKSKDPVYAPGIEDVDTIPRADSEDKAEGNVTKEIRVFLDENDPSGKDH
jgi:hypothetical protein